MKTLQKILLILFFSVIPFSKVSAYTNTALPVSSIPDEYMVGVRMGTVAWCEQNNLEGLTPPYYQCSIANKPMLTGAYEYKSGKGYEIFKGYTLWMCLPDNELFTLNTSGTTGYVKPKATDGFQIYYGLEMRQDSASMCRRVAFYDNSSSTWSTTRPSNWSTSYREWFGQKTEPIQNQVWTTQDLYADLLSGRNYAYGIGEVESGRYKIATKNWVDNPPIYGPPRPGKFRLKFRIEEWPQDEVIYMTDNKCTVDLTATGTHKPFSCGDGGDEAVLYYHTGGSTLYYDPVYLWVTDNSNPCSNLISSNYTLYDTEGNKVCQRSGSVLVPEYGETYQPAINWNPNDHDWGAFNWFKEPVSVFVDLINGIAEWFFNLWHGLLELIIPEPDFLSNFVQDIKQAISNKIEIIDISNLESLKNINENELQDVYVNLHGYNVPLIKYDQVKEHIGLLRSVLIGGLGLFLILFNVNQVNKLLSDEEVT